MKQIEKCCNMCGKTIMESGLSREDSICIEKTWGYFSEKDGEKHTIILCEKCYDMWIKTLKTPPHVEEITESLS